MSCHFLPYVGISANAASQLGVLGGLFLEALGATLLASDYLSRHHEEIRDFSDQTPVNDLETTDKGRERKTNFLSLTGFMVLALGFILQTGGMIFQYFRSCVMTLSVVFLLFLSLGSLAYMIISVVSNQRPKDVAVTYLRNVRSFFVSVRRELLNGSKKLRCDICRGPVSRENSQVWWIDDVTGSNGPIKVGHPDCLESNQRFENVSEGGGLETEIQRMSLGEFRDSEPVLRDEDMGHRSENNRLQNIYDYDLE